MQTPKAVKVFYEILKNSINEYRKDNCSFMAAAVSYYIFLSFIPLVLLAVSAASYFLGSSENAQKIVLGYTSSFSPGLTADSAFGIKSIISQVIRDRGTATGIGLVLLAWSGSSAISALEQSVNLAWNLEKKRSFLRSKLVSLAVMIFIILILMSSTLITAAIKTFKGLNIVVFGVPPTQWPWVWSIVGYAIPFLITSACFLVIYYFLPKTKVNFKSAIIASVVASVLWEIAKQAFSFYIIHIAKSSTVYGSLASIILFLGWIYSSAIVIIYGAELCSVLSEKKDK